MSEPRAGLRRVLVTGGGTGIGRAIAEKIVRAGGRVAICGRRGPVLDEVARAHPGRVTALPVDLADARARAALLERARTALGGLDGLVYSAGVVQHQAPGAIDEGALRQQIEVNLVAPLRLGEEALSVLEPGGGIVFVSSTLAERPIPTSIVYSAAKAGLGAVAKALAVAGAPRQIRVNVVIPGVVDTEMIRTLQPGRESLEAQLEALRALHPLGRLGAPEDVAEAVVYLLGAAWTTGAELRVDGGQLLRE